MYRQGDVGVIQSTLPKSAKQIKRVGKIILAHGEATGHAHVIESLGVRVFEHENTRWIRVPKRGADLTHEEHGTIALAPGDYRVVIQREYTPAAPVNVRD